MKVQQIDSRLLNDCHVLGKLEVSYLLLMNNANVPWFILVPETEQTEYYLLSDELQKSLNNEINWMSEFISAEYHPDKLNVATIGNVVKQMHVHIVGRAENDYCWPNVVWGVKADKSYPEEAVEAIKQRLLFRLDGLFKPLI